MHSVALILHSWMRWTVIVLLGTVLVRTGWRWRRAGAWTRGDERAHVALLAAADTQFALGLFLYFVASPITRAFWAAPGQGMPVSTLRFFGIEHITMMLLGLGTLHAGRRIAKRTSDVLVRPRRAFAWTLLATLLLLAGIPWPFLRAGRPLFRLPPSNAGVASVAPSTCTPLYASRCAACHGKYGRGDGLAAAGLTPPPRDFTDASWNERTGSDRLRAVIRDGGARVGLSAAMPADTDLSRAELDALIVCIREFGRVPR